MPHLSASTRVVADGIAQRDAAASAGDDVDGDSLDEPGEGDEGAPSAGADEAAQDTTPVQGARKRSPAVQSGARPSPWGDVNKRRRGAAESESRALVGALNALVEAFNGDGRGGTAASNAQERTDEAGERKKLAAALFLVCVAASEEDKEKGAALLKEGMCPGALSLEDADLKIVRKASTAISQGDARGDVFLTMVKMTEWGDQLEGLRIPADALVRLLRQVFV